MPRHLRIRKRFGAGSDAVAIKLHAGQAAGDTTGGDQDVFGRHLESLALRHNCNFAGVKDARRAQQPGDVVLLEEKFDTLRERSDDSVLALQHRLQIELRTAFNSVGGEAMPCFREEFARFEQRFAWDAADAQAGSAKRRFFFDAGCFQTKLRRANRRHVAARSRTDYNKIESFSWHNRYLGRTL